MSIKQLSVFVENKKGRLAEITRVLADNSIDIRALSIADTTDYGILRLIVDDPERANDALKAAGVTFKLTNVIGVAVSDAPGAFAKATQLLSDNGVIIEYAYAFITPVKGQAYIILRVDDNDRACAVLHENGIKLIEQNDIFE